MYATVDPRPNTKTISLRQLKYFPLYIVGTLLVAMLAIDLLMIAGCVVISVFPFARPVLNAWEQQIMPRPQPSVQANQGALDAPPSCPVAPEPATENPCKYMPNCTTTGGSDFGRMRQYSDYSGYSPGYSSGYAPSPLPDLRGCTTTGTCMPPSQQY
jgi:hypothetical protein